MQPVVIRIKNDINEIKTDVLNESIAHIEQQSSDPLTVIALVVAPISSNFKDDMFTVTMHFPGEYPVKTQNYFSS
jgi:ubiquitin-protein ligase